MNKALVSCRSCDRTWHSKTMAEGLRAVGCCPRCGGKLAWSDDEQADHEGAKPAEAGEQLAPHLVLGVPRR